MTSAREPTRWAGNDRISGDAGDDAIDGGPGTDTAVACDYVSNVLS